MGEPLLLALDQGTTSTRAILFDRGGKPLITASRPLRQSYPLDGWVEHDAEEIYAASVAVLREAVETSGRDVAVFRHGDSRCSNEGRTASMAASGVQTGSSSRPD